MNVIPKAVTCAIEVSAPGNSTLCLTIDGPSVSQSAATDGVSKTRRLDLWFDVGSILNGSIDLLELHQQQGLRFDLHMPAIDAHGRLVEVQQMNLPTATLIMLQFELCEPRQASIGLFSWIASFWPWSNSRQFQLG